MSGTLNFHFVPKEYFYFSSEFYLHSHFLFCLLYWRVAIIIFYERKENTTYGDIYSVQFINIFVSRLPWGLGIRKSSETYSAPKCLAWWKEADSSSKSKLKCHIFDVIIWTKIIWRKSKWYLHGQESLIKKVLCELSIKGAYVLMIWLESFAKGTEMFQYLLASLRIAQRLGKVYSSFRVAGDEAGERDALDHLIRHTDRDLQSRKVSCR